MLFSLKGHSDKFILSVFYGYRNRQILSLNSLLMHDIADYTEVTVMNSFCRTCVEFLYRKQKGLSAKKLKTLVIYGGPSGDRTRDLLIKSQLLYQLS